MTRRSKSLSKRTIKHSSLFEVGVNRRTLRVKSATLYERIVADSKRVLGKIEAEISKLWECIGREDMVCTVDAEMIGQ